jgi:hypothetical protein
VEKEKQLSRARDNSVMEKEKQLAEKEHGKVRVP